LLVSKTRREVVGSPVVKLLRLGDFSNPGVKGAIVSKTMKALVLASIVTSLFSGVWLRMMVRRSYAFDA